MEEGGRGSEWYNLRRSQLAIGGFKDGEREPQAKDLEAGIGKETDSSLETTRRRQAPWL